MQIEDLNELCLTSLYDECAAAVGDTDTCLNKPNLNGAPFEGMDGAGLAQEVTSIQTDPLPTSS